MVQVIQRPVRFERTQPNPDVVVALLQTQGQQTAVVLPCELGESAYGVYNRYRNVVQRKGLRFRGRQSRGKLYGWVETR